MQYKMDKLFWIFTGVLIFTFILLVLGIILYYYAKNNNKTTAWAWILIALGIVGILIGAGGMIYISLK
jgi:steroid 5-alpha reductase family enzyme